MPEDVVQNPHDRFFRKAFGKRERAHALLESVLPPEVSRCMDWTSLRLEPGSYLDEQLRERISDLLYTVKADGTDLHVYCLIEHQSTPDRWMPLRTLSYQVRIWEEFRRKHPLARQLPAIIPVVLYQGEAAWTDPMDLAQLVAVPGESRDAFEQWIPKASFIFLPLQQTDLDKVVADLSVRLILRFMREIVITPTTERIRNCFEVIPKLCECENDAAFIRTCLTYLFDQSGEVDTAFFKQQIEITPFGKLKEDIMTLAEQFIEEGRQEAFRQSIAEVLEARFGALPDDLPAALSSVEALPQLHALLRIAACCPDLDSFRASLQPPNL
jgi:hypothetical protein